MILWIPCKIADTDIPKDINILYTDKNDYKDFIGKPVAQELKHRELKFIY